MHLILSPEERLAFAALSEVQEGNRAILRLYSRYLNEHPCLVTPEMIGELRQDCNATDEEAFVAVLAAAFDLEEERGGVEARLVREYLPRSVRRLDPAVYRADPYFQNIRVPQKKENGWSLTQESYAPYEGFICGPLQMDDRFAEIPPLGFFAEPFSFPAVMQNGQEWMAVKPNEIETMRAPVAEAAGEVLTYGLGLGYFAYMASQKESVSSLTVVERDPTVIALFERELLPQFPNRHKIRLLCADAFDFAQAEAGKGPYDYIFTDLWRDTGDGLSLYLKMRRLESPRVGRRYAYWIEDQLLSSLRALVFDRLLAAKGAGEGSPPAIRGMEEVRRMLGTGYLRALASDLRPLHEE